LQSSTAAAPKVKQALVEGVTLNYLEQGQGVTVVFVHGASSDHRVWEAQRVVETRHAAGGIDRLPDLAAELARLKVDVIVAAPTAAIQAAHQATRTSPIIMAFSDDPVGEGLVAGLARPDGNILELSAAMPALAAKRIEFFRVIVPDMARNERDRS
jgi:ABC transporter substrate binding protein